MNTVRETNTVREEDQSRNNNNCPSRGLGLAAAAIGVGVGAALYYYFSKSPEDPHRQGATSTWREEQALPIHFHETLSDNEDEYTTISEHSTTDTSINNESVDELSQNMSRPHSETISSDSDSSDSSDEVSPITRRVEASGSDSYTSEEVFISSDTDDEMNVSENHSNITISSDSSDDQIHYMSRITVDQTSNMDTETDAEFDVTTSSDHIPVASRGAQVNRLNRIMGNVSTIVRPRRRTAESNRLNNLRGQKFRQRSWSLEECSICFDVILKDQEVTSLPCTHNFHTACIKPWLESQHTCPNCRKAAQ